MIHLWRHQDNPSEFLPFILNVMHSIHYNFSKVWANLIIRPVSSTFFFCTDLNQTATKSLMRPAFCINFITRNTRLPQFWGCFLLALTAARGDEEIQRVSSCGWQSCCQQLAGDEGLQCLSHLQLLGPIKTLLRCIKYIPDIAFLCKQTQAGREVMWWGVGHETIF